MSRLDVYLTEHHIYASRERAKRAVQEGLVSVNGQVVTKASFEVCEEDTVSGAKDPVPFVSRGGLKLEGAFAVCSIDVKGCSCLDVGASTGGFTQVLLNRGAASVTAVDVGHGQLAEELKNDRRVINLEGRTSETCRRTPVKRPLILSALTYPLFPYPRASLRVFLHEAGRYLSP